MRAMKDSGLQWIGEVPSDWTLTRIAGLYSVRNEKVSDKDFPPLSVLYRIRHNSDYAEENIMPKFFVI